MATIGGDVDPALIELAADLDRLDRHLASRTFLDQASLSASDRAVFALIYGRFVALSDADRMRRCCLVRWFDHIQHADRDLDRAAFPLVAIKLPLTSPATVAPGASAPTKKEKKVKGTSPFAKASAVAVVPAGEAACLEIRVGHIVQVEPHATDAKLYVEQIDVGEARPRQVVSGLVPFVPIASMQGRLVCVLVNIAASEIKGVASAGLVLCASNADHTVVEPIEPPAAAVVGEKVTFPGVVGDAESVIKPKKLYKLFKSLKTTADDTPLAAYEGVVFTTSAGPVSVPSLKSCLIK